MNTPHYIDNPTNIILIVGRALYNMMFSHDDAAPVNKYISEEKPMIPVDYVDLFARLIVATDKTQVSSKKGSHTCNVQFQDGLVIIEIEKEAR